MNEYCKNCYKLAEENAKLKEQIIKLTEENGNLIINRNTVKNKLQDTESRLISVQKANTHNLVLLQRRNYALEEIKEVFKKYDSEEEGTVAELLHDVFEVYGRVCEVLKDE